MKTKVKHGIILLLVITSCFYAQSTKTIDLLKDWCFAPDIENIGISNNWFVLDFDDSHWDIIDAGKRWED